MHSYTANLHQNRALKLSIKSGVLRQHHYALWQNCGIVT